jgi:hypothetical protein
LNLAKGLFTAACFAGRAVSIAAIFARKEIDDENEDDCKTTTGR